MRWAEAGLEQSGVPSYKCPLRTKHSTELDPWVPVDLGTSLSILLVLKRLLGQTLNAISRC